jgi:predicted nucleotidyltransferase
MNAETDGVHYVEEIWLFGSVLRGAPTVGDIDLALIVARRPEFQAEDVQERQAHLKNILAARDDMPRGFFNLSPTGRLSLGWRTWNCSVRAALRRAQFLIWRPRQLSF